MAKFSGAVGYSESQETAPGVYTDVMTERQYYGDIIRDQRRLEPNAIQVNDDIRVDNSFSLVADAYAIDNITAMRYIVWNGKPWAVTNAEVRRPRLILSIGGLWNGNTA
jgi:hypothetical protein